MTPDNIPNYLHLLSRLNRANVTGMGKAPHKPILLLSVLHLIRNGNITSNRIFITAELVLAFKSNWSCLVNTSHTPNFALPFFHLKGEPFWNVQFNADVIPAASAIKSINNFAALKRIIAYAEIDRDLFILMLDATTAIIIENLLLDTYFPLTRQRYLQLEENVSRLENEIAEEIVNDPPEIYQAKMEALSGTSTENEIEEERFVRNSIFKREVPKIYDQRCCISGMRIQTGLNIQMIDACHIVPFSISRDDTLSNGISLCPNLHRAFDRGILTITERFVVRISPLVKEDVSVFTLKQFDGKQILLPNETRHFPSTENLAWHRKERFVM